jgi:spore germination protein YaaH
MKWRLILTLGVIAGPAACTPLPPGVRAPTEIWGLWSPDPSGTGVSPAVADSQHSRLPDGISAVADTWIALDSVSFRPTVLSRVSEIRLLAEKQSPSSLPSGNPRRLSVVTSFQGRRYHPEVVRGLIESSDALAVTAGSIASVLSASAPEGVILDFQEMTADDIQTLVDVSRAIADSARSHSVKAIAMMIPAADSSGYPARILGRIADLLLVKLFPEHGVSTPAGPIVSSSWFTRRLGLRASEAGVNRIVAGVPTDGVIWDNRGGARRITYSDALRLSREANAPLVRDPASGNLHAVSSRDGWELWVVDHELVEKLIAEGRRIGVTRFALIGLEGADPELWEILPRLVGQNPPGP